MKHSQETVTVKDSNQKEIGTQTYQKDIFEGMEDIMAIWNQPAVAKSETTDKLAAGSERILNALNYGWDLKKRVVVRGQILSALPASIDKSIEKFAKDLFKRREEQGKPITMEKALAKARLYYEEEEESAA